MHDETYEAAMDEWIDAYRQWKAGTHPYCSKEKYSTARAFVDSEGGPPKHQYYRPKWTPEQEASLGYCVYETTSEGTPMSPVFASKPELVDWLVGQGRSRASAEAFVEREWAPSFVLTVTPDGERKFQDGIDASEPAA